MISEKMKERFCKDCGISINIFKEPYFTERLMLFDKYFDCLEKWRVFREELAKYNSEQDFMEEYNRVKDKAIEHITTTAGYKEFNSMDMNKFSVSEFVRGLPKKPVFKDTNVGRVFISLDIRKANFSTLYHYDSEIFKSADDSKNITIWEDFISAFTDNAHIINSKYIRQVIMGNCNPKRQSTYEKYLMGIVVDKLREEINNSEFGKEDESIKFIYFSNDEVVLDVTDAVGCNYNTIKAERLYDIIESFSSKMVIPLKVEMYKLFKIVGTQGYCKHIKDNNDDKYDFKCLDAFTYPTVLRYYKSEPVTVIDLTFMHEGRLAKYLESPNIQETCV